MYGGEAVAPFDQASQKAREAEIASEAAGDHEIGSDGNEDLMTYLVSTFNILQNL